MTQIYPWELSLSIRETLSVITFALYESERSASWLRFSVPKELLPNDRVASWLELRAKVDILEHIKISGPCQGSKNYSPITQSLLGICHTGFTDSLRAVSVLSWSCSQAVSIPVWHVPLLCVQWKTPDNKQRNCPKHVEFYSKNKFWEISASSWFYYENLSRCTVTWTSNSSEKSFNSPLLQNAGTHISLNSE